jgi:hypothetical protein
MRFIALLALLGMTARAFGADVKTYRYEVENYPKSAAGCHAAAKEVGDRFAVTTSMGVKLARCLKEDADGYRLRIEYDAEVPAPLVSTRVFPSSVYPLGQYKDRAACDTKLPALKDKFEKETGLGAMVAYCDRDDFANETPWYAHIDGFGAAAKRPWVTGYLVFGVPLQYQAGQYGRELLAGLAKAGIDVTHVRSHSGSAYGAISITYYSAKRHDFEAAEITKTIRPKECLDQLATARQELEAFAVKPLMVYCAKTMLGTVEMTTVHPGKPDYVLTPSVEKFPSFAACIAGREGLIRKYQTELKIPIEGGVCKGTSRGYEVLLFERRP